MLNDIKFDFILKVTELPYRGTNTMIQVAINDDILNSFLAKPDDEYLETVLTETVDSISEYLKNKNMNDKGFIY